MNLKDVRIKIDNKRDIDEIINHALTIGYYVDLHHEKYLLKADYLLLDPNQSMRWCTEDIYTCSLNYEEMTVEKFLDYQGGM